MPNIIDLSTPDKLEAFGNAMQAAARTGKPVNLADVAEASGTLEGRKVCYETEHYQITDAGEPTTEWERRWQYRFSISRKPEFAKSRVLDFPLRSSRVCAEDLLDSLKEAEKFHMDNLPFCGGLLMSKLSHSHQPSMNLIERHRLVEDGILREPSKEALENGENCAICFRPIECTGRPCACEECGGDAVLAEDGIEEAIADAGQFGVGA